VRNLASVLFLLAFLRLLPAARADQSNQATKVTLSQPVQIPGPVLPAGTVVPAGMIPLKLPQIVNKYFQCEGGAAYQM
jgi:hypothetical protein